MLVGMVSVGKHSMTLFGDVWCRFCLMLVRESGFLARRATARLPWEGCERMLAMLVPWEGVRIVTQEGVYGETQIWRIRRRTGRGESCLQCWDQHQ